MEIATQLKRVLPTIQAMSLTHDHVLVNPNIVSRIPFERLPHALPRSRHGNADMRKILEFVLNRAHQLIQPAIGFEVNPVRTFYVCKTSAKAGDVDIAGPFLLLVLYD